jgi:hypothetical protein
MMDPSLEKLKNRIEKLTAQQHQIEEKYINAVGHLVKDLTRKGVDLPILTGIILNAGNIITESPAKTEVWQSAGQKFLLRAKNKNSQSQGKQKQGGAATA